MDHYIDIRVLPDPEFTASVLMDALFAKLHRSLGQLTDGKVGVSFPEHDRFLGSVLRLHGTAEALRSLQASRWYKGLSDYTEQSDILPVPAETMFRTVRRVQMKSSAERLRRRSVKKGWLTEQQAQEQITFAQEKRTTLPAIQMKSISTGQMFLLFIEHGPLVHSGVAGHFSSYGLSTTTTVPWF